MQPGAFLHFAPFLFEKRNKQPSPTWVMSERGREDKPLTPVLYSTREGGELYGAIFFRYGKNTTSVRRFGKENAERRSKNYQIELVRRAAREVVFSDLSEKELAQLFTMDEYESDYSRFQVSGFDVIVKMNCLPKPLTPCPKENAILSLCPISWI